MRTALRLPAFWLALSVAVAHAQTAPPLTIDQVIAQSVSNYAAVRVSNEQVAAAAAGINLARTAYLPKVDGLAQVNRATRNNVFGMLMPNSVIPPISGPPNPNNNLTNIWGSAVGFLVSWEPFDFGLRKAQVDAAGVTRRRAEAAVERTRFEVSSAAADLFLTVLAAQQTVAAAQAGVERARVLHESVSALVKADLRPGAEAARTRAELAMAETQRIQADQAVRVAKAALSQFLGSAGVDLDPARFLGDAPGEQTAAGADHPAVREQTAAMDETKARGAVLDHAYFPKFNLQSALYARGTGSRADLTAAGGAYGLGPNIHNWGIGFTVTMPLMEFAAIREKKAIEAANGRVEAARLSQIRQDIDAQVARAQAMFDGARAVAKNIPVQVEAARAAETQATARYKAGLGTIAEVAEAQRLLTQSEIDEKLARLQIWRAHLALAAARGDLAPFLEMAKR